MPLPRFVTSLLESLRGRPAQPVAIPAKASSKKSADAEGLRKLILSGGAPDDLTVVKLDLSGESRPFRLPSRLRCFELNLANSSVRELPPGIQVAHKIDLTGCVALRELPANLTTGSLVLKDCTALVELPENLAVHFLTLDGCRVLTSWPASARVTLGHVSARQCPTLMDLPPTLGPISSLDLSGCAALESIPEGVRVTSWVGLDGSGIKAVPETWREVSVRKQ